MKEWTSFDIWDSELEELMNDIIYWILEEKVKSAYIDRHVLKMLLKFGEKWRIIKDRNEEHFREKVVG